MAIYRINTFHVAFEPIQAIPTGSNRRVSRTPVITGIYWQHVPSTRRQGITSISTVAIIENLFSIRRTSTFTVPNTFMVLC